MVKQIMVALIWWDSINLGIDDYPPSWAESVSVEI